MRVSRSDGDGGSSELVNDHQYIFRFHDFWHSVGDGSGRDLLDNLSEYHSSLHLE